MNKLTVSESEVSVTYGSITALVTQPEAVKLITDELAQYALNIIRNAEDQAIHQRRYAERERQMGTDLKEEYSGQVGPGVMLGQKYAEKRDYADITNAASLNRKTTGY